jgi:diguanylate cyclase (GGDEF)-like protein/PAS domain S-box-containing protein
MTNVSRGKEPQPFPMGRIYGDESRIAFIFYVLLSLVLVSLLAGVLILLSNKNELEALSTGVAILPVLIAFPLVYRKKFEAAASLLAISMITLMTVLAVLGQGIHNISVLGFPAVLIVSSLVVRRRIMLLLTIYSILCAGWLVFGDILGFFTPFPFAHSVPGDFPAIAMILIATALLVRMLTESLFNTNQRLQEELAERKQTEQALAFSEKKFHQAFHSSPVIMTIEDSNGMFVDVNQAFCEAFGYSREEVVGHKPSEFNLWGSEQDLQLVKKLNEAGGNLRNVELHIRRSSGEIGVVLLSTDRFEANGLTYDITSALEITKRIQAVEALRRSEALYRQAIEVANAVPYHQEYHVDGKSVVYDFIGEGIRQITGYGPEEFSEALWDSLTEERVLLDDLAQYPYQKAIQRVRSGASPVWKCEHRIRARDGSIHSVLESAVELRDQDGLSHGSIGLFQDITERKRMEEILFDEKERAEVTLHSIGDAVITTDVNSVVEYLNPAAEHLTGWSLQEALGQPVGEVFKVREEDSNHPAVNPVARCLELGQIYTVPPHSILVRRDGMEFSIADTAAPIRNRKDEIVGVVLVFHDVTEERRLAQQVAHDAMHDSLTGLVNRREFERRLERALVSVRERGFSHMLCYLDLDQFKIVNDTAGHAAGDEMLKQFTRLISSVFRKRDTFARLGGDEFGLLLENCDLDQALLICNEILARTRAFTFAWEKRNFQVGVSIGVTPVLAGRESVAQLLSKADIACYTAKDLGRNRFFVYHNEDSDAVQRHVEIMQAARMRDAIAHDQFLLYCQPIAMLKERQPVFNQYEVLLRMTDDKNQLVLPQVFIPPAERYGLMGAIDRWVIRQTLTAMSRHDMQGMQITINLSGNSLDDEHLLEYVLGQLQEFSIPPSQICFEITETAAIQHLNQAQAFARGFRQQGGKIALDDFGSGFSSFRYLKSLPVDTIKIDGSFVSGLLSNPGDLLMVEAITQIAHALDIEVTAEYAEDGETIERLREIGVERAQGFGIGYPAPVEDVWKPRNLPQPG